MLYETGHRNRRVPVPDVCIVICTKNNAFYALAIDKNVSGRVL